MGSNREKKPWTNLQNSYKNWSKEIKSDNFCNRKVGRAITKWGAIEKNAILLSQYWKISIFKGQQKLFRILMVATIFSPTVSGWLENYFKKRLQGVINLFYSYNVLTLFVVCLFKGREEKNTNKKEVSISLI